MVLAMTVEKTPQRFSHEMTLFPFQYVEIILLFLVEYP